MASNTIFIGDKGTEINIDVGVDTTLILSSKIYAKSPTGEVKEWNTSISGVSSIKYIITDNDITESGDWILQPYIVLSDWSGFGTKVRMQVSNNITNI